MRLGWGCFVRYDAVEVTLHHIPFDLIITLLRNYLQNNLAISENVSTFAPAFEAARGPEDGGIAQLVRALDS